MRKQNNVLNVSGVVCLVILALSVTAKASVDVQEEEETGFKVVKELTSSNFDEMVEKQELSAVFFYAPWCGHCKRAKPEWEKAAQMLSESDEIPLFAVNADQEENRPLAQRFGVQGFPTITIFRSKDGNLKEIPYKGMREAKDFAEGVKSFAGPATSYLDQADKEKLMNPSDPTKVTVIAFLDDVKSDYAKNFEDAADMMRGDGYFYTTDNFEVAKVVHEDLKMKANTLLVFRHHDGELSKSETIGSAEDVTNFINKNYCPPFLAFNELTQNMNDRVFNGDFTYNVFMYGDSDKQEAVAKWAAKLPERFDGKISPTIIFEAKSPESRIANYFGLKEELELSVAIVDLSNDKARFIMQESATEKATFQFLEDVVAGKIEPTLKSEEIPATNDAPVKVVVGKQFEELVLGGKNVLLEVYAPWCGHCKALEPTYNELAEELAEDTDVVIAKLDGTANDISDNRFEFRGFPTLFWVNSEGQVEQYQGAREMAAMKEFIEENKTPVTASAGGAKKEEL